MSVLLGENGRQDNGDSGGHRSSTLVHPALHSWREELPSIFMRTCAYLGGLAVLSIVAAQYFQSTPAIDPIKPAYRSAWVTIDRPFPAYALDIPEAAGAPASYVSQRNVEDGGRKDILTLGEARDASPFLEVEIYRAGREGVAFDNPKDELGVRAAAAGPVVDLHMEAPMPSKFGELSIAAFDITGEAVRHCLGFLRQFDDPPLQIAGRFCQGGADYIERSTLDCALDRLMLLAAGSEPKIGALFAQAELNRRFCGERDPILAATPKYKLLWRALANRPEPRRIGR
jgi:hypothetical protein